MQAYWAFGITIALILAGILFNRQDAKELRSEIGTFRIELGALRTELGALRTEMHREFREFYRTLGQHDAKIEVLEKK